MWIKKIYTVVEKIVNFCYKNPKKHQKLHSRVLPLTRKEEKITLTNENNKISLYEVLIEILSRDEFKREKFSYLVRTWKNLWISCYNLAQRWLRDKSVEKLWKTIFEFSLYFLRWRWAMAYITLHHVHFDASANGLFLFTVFCFKIRHKLSKDMHICKYYERIL